MSMTRVEVEKALKQLRLSGVCASLETRVLEAQVSSQPFMDTFAAILQDELDRRETRLMERHYQQSRLDERASLADFDWHFNPRIPKKVCFELNTLKFIAEGDNAVLLGPPGTGKSHIAKALAYSAVRAGLRVLYAEADDLLNALTLATPPEKRQRLKLVLDADLLVLDDLFMARKLVQESGDELQSLMHKRYKLKRSTLITSNRVIQDWEKYLGDTIQATTILDRLMHRSILVEFKGRSYRLDQAASRLAKGQAPE